MRLFVSLFLPDAIRDSLVLRTNPKQETQGIRWLPKTSLHITLKFFGNTQADKIPLIESGLARVLKTTGPLQLFCEDGGVYPSMKNPRVFWVGVKGEIEKLTRLARRFEEEFESLGFPIENRRFSPHITVGRIDLSRVTVPEISVSPHTVSEQFCTLFSGYKSPMFETTQIHLVQSHLNPQGVRYELLKSFPLESH